jgi:hypothetical protein
VDESFGTEDLDLLNPVNIKPAGKTRLCVYIVFFSPTLPRRLPSNYAIAVLINGRTYICSIHIIFFKRYINIYIYIYIIMIKVIKFFIFNER